MNYFINLYVCIQRSGATVFNIFPILSGQFSQTILCPRSRKSLDNNLRFYKITIILIISKKSCI